MTVEVFIDYIIEKSPASAGDTSAFFKHMMADNSDAMLEQYVTRKKAALILYAFMKDTLGLKDIDWGAAKAFRDIYDCRVCANAIAQVCVRGIMLPKKPDYFGGELLMEDDELNNAVFRLLEGII